MKLQDTKQRRQQENGPRNFNKQHVCGSIDD